MAVKKIIKEYFTEPFVYLGLSLFIIGVSSEYNSLINDFRGLLFGQFFYYCIFFPTFFLSVALVTEPLKNSIKEYRKRKQLHTGIMMIIAIFVSLMINAMPPQLEPHMFFSDEFNAIKDKTIVVELKAYVIGGGLLVAPAILIFWKWQIYKQLSKDKIKVDTQVDYGIIFSIALLIFIMCIVGVTCLTHSHIS